MLVQQTYSKKDGFMWIKNDKNNNTADPDQQVQPSNHGNNQQRQQGCVYPAGQSLLSALFCLPSQAWGLVLQSQHLGVLLKGLIAHVVFDLKRPVPELESCLYIVRVIVEQNDFVRFYDDFFLVVNISQHSRDMGLLPQVFIMVSFSKLYRVCLDINLVCIPTMKDNIVNIYTSMLHFSTSLQYMTQLLF